MLIDDELVEILTFKSEAFDTIANFITETYGNMSVSNVAPEEAFIIGVIRMANRMVSSIITPSEFDEDEEEED